MNKTSFVTAIITTISSLHAAEHLDASIVNESFPRMNAQAELPANQTLLRASTFMIPVALLPYAQHAETSENVRLYLTAALYEEHQTAVDASGVSIVIVSDEDFLLMQGRQRSLGSMESMGSQGSQESYTPTVIVSPSQPSTPPTSPAIGTQPCFLAPEL